MRDAIKAGQIGKPIAARVFHAVNGLPDWLFWVLWLPMQLGNLVVGAVVGAVVALALPAPITGWVIDTPGLRSFGLAHVTAQDMLWAFPDLEDGAVQCPGGCEHMSAADGCRLDQWVATGHSSISRLEAFRRLLTSRTDLGEP